MKYIFQNSIYKNETQINFSLLNRDEQKQIIKSYIRNTKQNSISKREREGEKISNR